MRCATLAKTRKTARGVIWFGTGMSSLVQSSGEPDCGRDRQPLTGLAGGRASAVGLARIYKGTGVYIYMEEDDERQSLSLSISVSLSMVTKLEHIRSREAEYKTHYHPSVKLHRPHKCQTGNRARTSLATATGDHPSASEHRYFWEQGGSKAKTLMTAKSAPNLTPSFPRHRRSSRSLICLCCTTLRRRR